MKPSISNSNVTRPIPVLTTEEADIPMINPVLVADLVATAHSRKGNATAIAMREHALSRLKDILSTIRSDEVVMVSDCVCDEKGNRILDESGLPKRQDVRPVPRRDVVERDEMIKIELQYKANGGV